MVYNVILVVEAVLDCPSGSYNMSLFVWILLITNCHTNLEEPLERTVITSTWSKSKGEFTSIQNLMIIVMLQHLRDEILHALMQ